MITGMLWFDNDKTTDLPNKVARAAAYYQKKYGETPNLCYVHPQTVTGTQLEHCKVEVKTSETILPYHFWIGVAKPEAV